MYESQRRYAAYSRVSTDGQERGSSHAEQLAACQRYGEAQGWRWVGEFSDEISGTVEGDTRPGMMQIIQLLQDKKITDVIISAIDRLARDISVLRNLYAQVYALGGKITIAHKNRTYASFYEAFDDSLLESVMAMKERDMIQRRTESGKEFAFTHNAIIANPKTGYKRVRVNREINGRIHNLVYAVVDESQAQFVRHIVDTIITEGTKNAAMTKLNKSRFKSIKGKDIGTHVLDDICASIDLYAGLPVEESIKLANGTRTLKRMQTYPAIIDPETAETLRRTVRVLRRSNAKADKPFLGVVRCMKCGRTAFIARNATAKYGYLAMCSTYKNALTHNQRLGRSEYTTPCKHHISLPVVVDALLDYLDNETDSVMFSFSRLLSNTVLQIIDSRIGVETLEKEIDSLEVELKNSTESAKELLKRSRLTALLDAIEAEVVETQDKITIYRDKLDSTIQSVEKMKSQLASLGIVLTSEEYDVADKLRASGGLDDMQDIDKRINESLTLIYNRVIKKHTRGVTRAFDDLRSALVAENWETVNMMMKTLQLTVGVDFSEPDREKRRRSPRVRLGTLLPELVHRR